MNTMQELTFEQINMIHGGQRVCNQNTNTVTSNESSIEEDSDGGGGVGGTTGVAATGGLILATTGFGRVVGAGLQARGVFGAASTGARVGAIGGVIGAAAGAAIGIGLFLYLD